MLAVEDRLGTAGRGGVAIGEQEAGPGVEGVFWILTEVQEAQTWDKSVQN